MSAQDEMPTQIDRRTTVVRIDLCCAVARYHFLFPNLNQTLNQYLIYVDTYGFCDEINDTESHRFFEL